MIAFAKAFMILGALAGVCGILGGLGLCLAWINDRWMSRDRRAPRDPFASLDTEDRP